MIQPHSSPGLLAEHTCLASIPPSLSVNQRKEGKERIKADNEKGDSWDRAQHCTSEWKVFSSSYARGGFLRCPANTVTQRVVISAIKSLGFVRSNEQVKSLLLIFPIHTLMTSSPANEVVTLHRDFCGLFYLWLMSGVKGEGIVGRVRTEVGVS